MVWTGMMVKEGGRGKGDTEETKDTEETGEEGGG
jgi:hypothetical protein